jgi:hypothetical protein
MTNPVETISAPPKPTLVAVATIAPSQSGRSQTVISPWWRTGRR